MHCPFGDATAVLWSVCGVLLLYYNVLWSVTAVLWSATAVLWSDLWRCYCCTVERFMEVSLYCEAFFRGGITAVPWRHYRSNPIRLTGR